DYRYMSGDEQNFLMTELARLKDAGRIEVIRERSANFHVFAFIDGKRLADDLITAAVASMEEGSATVQDAHHATKESAKPATKSRTVGKKKATSKAKANSKAKPNSK
ncbi:MAG: hypothetical protein ABR501_13665, partial [Pyrinomonadaceae bacterium]